MTTMRISTDKDKILKNIAKLSRRSKQGQVEHLIEEDYIRKKKKGLL